MSHRNQIVLTFPDKETADYIRLICKRKCITLENYILENFEWDDQLICVVGDVQKITALTCEGCDYLGTCPDGAP